MSNLSSKAYLLLANDDQPLDYTVRLYSLKYDNETAIRLVRKHCLESQSPEIQKKGMEFLYINGLYEDLKVLIHKNKHSNYKSNQQWGQTYELMLNRRKKNYSHAQLFRQIHTIETDEPELKCLLEFINIATYFQRNDFRRVGNFLNRIDCLLYQIEDPFLLTNFRKRLNQRLFVYYWARNEVIMARKFAYQILNKTMNIKTKINIHMNLGLSYLFDTYSQGMYHLQEALRLAKQHNHSRYTYVLENNNIPFFSAHFQRVAGVETEDKSEQAHVEIAKGNKEKAITILSQLSINSPFRLYYLGAAKEDKNILLRSYESFIKDRSDYFFGRLPMYTLREMDGFK